MSSPIALRVQLSSAQLSSKAQQIRRRRGMYVSVFCIAFGILSSELDFMIL